MTAHILYLEAIWRIHADYARRKAQTRMWSAYRARRVGMAQERAA